MLCSAVRRIQYMCLCICVYSTEFPELYSTYCTTASVLFADYVTTRNRLKNGVHCSL